MFHVPNVWRVRHGVPAVYCSNDSYGNNGLFRLPVGEDRVVANCLCGEGAGWEHVSVSIPGRDATPTWEEMDAVKRVFGTTPTAWRSCMCHARTG